MVRYVSSDVISRAAISFETVNASVFYTQQNSLILQYKIDDNSLTGEIPSELGNMKALLELNLRKCMKFTICIEVLFAHVFQPASLSRWESFDRNYTKSAK